MDFFATAERRHSYRANYLDHPLPREDLIQIVTTGMHAPSGKNAQTTEFVIIDDPDLLAQLRQMARSLPHLASAPALIAVVLNEQAEELPCQIEGYAAAVENMLLAITALGYASVWLDSWLTTEGRAATVGDLLDVPAGKVVRALLPVGKPIEIRSQAPKKPFAQRAWFNGHNRAPEAQDRA